MIQKTEILRQLRLILPEELIQENIPLSTLTTMRVGGPAALLVATKDILQVREVLRYLHKESIPFVVLGKGSNVLASDEGYDSVILQLTNLQQITVEGNKLRAQGGASLIAMARAAQSAGLAGLEFASGIPGTLGGALYMNAGAYGFEMQDVVLEVEAVDERGELLTLGVDDLNFGYRSSVFREKSLVAVSSLLQLKQDDP
ncbi:MAG: FAD-binding protein, partial [Lachnospiraceae bacterium]|nr:FAD-binding protein [Lachnospiraceae bacterium]